MRFCQSAGLEYMIGEKMKNSKEMTYREITISDYDEIIRLWKNTPGMSIGEADSRENMEKFFIRNPGLCFCAEQNGRIIGTVLAAHDGRRGFIYHLAVETIFRSKGIGGFLAKKSLKAMKS